MCVCVSVYICVEGVLWQKKSAVTSDLGHWKREPSSPTCAGSASAGSRLSKVVQMSPFLGMLRSSSWGDSQAFPSHMRHIISLVCTGCIPGSPTLTCPINLQRKASRTIRIPLFRCPNHLDWLLSVWRSSSSTSSSLPYLNHTPLILAASYLQSHAFF